jgi:hypothetical protein
MTTKASPHCIFFGSKPQSLLDLFLSTERIFFEQTTTCSTRMRGAYDFFIDDLRTRQDTFAASLRLDTMQALSKV